MNQSNSPHQPLFRFLQMSDLHVTNDSVRASFPGAVDRARWLISEIAAGSLSDVELVLCVGDSVQAGSVAETREDLTLFTKMTKALDQPVLAVPGNHETQKREGDPAYADVFTQAFGVPGTNYTHRHRDLLFVMLDNSGTTECNAETYSQRERWLKKTLEDHRHEPKIVCCHVPLVPMRDPETLAQTMKIESWMTREPEILTLIEEHAESILAVFSGHLHLTGLVCRNSVFHITVSGTASYPSDYALYSVLEDRIEMEAKQLPSELLNHETDLHAIPRRDFTAVDDTHPTHAEYVMGTYDERRFAIPTKRPTA